MISDNVVAVQVNHILGPKETAAHAEKFGFQFTVSFILTPGSNEVTPLVWPLPMQCSPIRAYNEPIYTAGENAGELF